MGWQDAPVVSPEQPDGSAWESAPLVDEAPKITKENWLSHAADEIQKIQEQRDSLGAARMNTNEQLAVQDVFRRVVGLKPVSAGRDFYQEALSRSGKASPWLGASRAALKQMHGIGTGVVGVVSPEAGTTLRQQATAAYGKEEIETLAAKAGGLVGGAWGSALAVLNPVAGATALGISAAGSERIDIAAARRRGQEIGGGAEFLAATGAGAVEMFTEYIGGKLARWGGSLLKASGSTLVKAFKTGGKRGLVSALRKLAPKVIGFELAALGEGAEEVVATVAQNWISQGLWDEKRGLIDDAGEAFKQGYLVQHLLAPLGAAVQMSGGGRTRTTPTGEGGPSGPLGPTVPGTENFPLPPLATTTPDGGPLAVIPKKPALVTPPPGGAEPIYSQSGPALPRVLTPFPPAGSIQVPQILGLIEEAGRQIDQAKESLPVEATKTPDQVVEYLTEQGEETAEVVRPMLGTGLFVLRDVPVSAIDTQIPTPESIKPEKAARAKARKAGEAPAPVVLGEQGEVVDGQHRVLEAQKRKEAVVPAWVPHVWAAEHGMANPITEPALPQPKSVVSQESQIHPMPAGAESVKPHATYNAADAAIGPQFGPAITPGQGRNPWIRPSAEATNERRVLLVQFSSDLINADRPRTSADDYYDKLYQNRPGYARPSDFWELPRWIGIAAKNLPNSDVYVVRDLGEARQFLSQAGYSEIAFSALNINSKLVQALVEGYEGKVAVGGYTDMAPFQGRPNITVYEGMPDWIKTHGRQFQPGTDYRHFRDTEVVPRLCMSTGCLHACTFCAVAGKGKHPTVTTKEAVAQQVKSFGDLRAKLVYLDDKTFGQAENYRDLVDIRKQMQDANPDFEGFIIQTSAAQLAKMDPQFIQDAGIKYVELGVESYNDPILRAMKKPASEKMIDQAAEKIREAGVEFVPNVMISLPGETADTYARTLDFLNRNADIISHVNAYNVALYEGSELDAEIGAQTESDRDENVTQKSWQKTPEVDQAFHDQVMEFASRALDRPVGDTAIAAAQKEIEADLPTSAAEPKPGPIDGFSRDEQGAVPVAALGRLASRTIAPIGSLFNSVMGEISFTLRHSAAGRVLCAKLDTVATKAASMVGQIENQAADAYHNLTRDDRKWLSAVDVNGYSNLQRLIEDTPSGPLTVPNDAVERMLAAYANMIDATGLEAIRVGVQAVTPTGEVIDFKQAQSGRFLRNLTPDAFVAIHQGSGPLFDAITRAIARDNGVGLAKAGEFLREWLGPQAVRRAGQLERLRAIKHLPSAVDLGGSVVAIQETDPYLAIMGNAKRQARRIYFIEEFGQNIGGQPTEIERLRAEYQRDGGKVADFDDVITVFERRPYKRVFTDPRNPLNRVLRVADSIVATAQTSLSAVPNLPQTLVLVPKYVGVKNYLGAVVRAIRHPRQTTAQLAAMGAMNRAVIDWTLRPGHGPEDFVRIMRGMVARGTGLEALSQFNNMVAGEGFRRLADVWRKTGISSKDIAVARDLRLTPAEIAAVNAGEMTQPVYNKITQNGVKITQFITEDPHRMSKLQHIPLLNGLFAYNNYAIGTAKAVARTVRETGKALASRDPKQAGAAARRITLLLAGSVGAGTVSLLLRRAIKGQPPIREDETLLAILGKALWEVSLLGPTQRMQDAFSYSGGTTEKAMVNLSPKLVAIAQVVDLLRGGGRWGELPLSERAQKTVTKLTPLIRSLDNWYDKLQYPKLEIYRKARSMAGAYRPRVGQVPEVAINPRYYAIHTAILHDDEAALKAALYSYQVWATEQGQDDETARRNLRSALSSRRPANFNLADYREFLASLSPQKRHLVETAQAHYATAVDEITLTPEEKAARRGDIAELSRLVQAGQINVGRARQVMRRSKQSPLQRRMDEASFKDSLRVWATASSEERVLIRPQILAKARSAIKRTPAKQQEILVQLRTMGLIQ